jgi:hypothetical protein
MKVYFHDNTPAAPGEKHGSRGPTHCATATVDYEYQVEQHVIDAGNDLPYVVRIECPDLVEAAMPERAFMKDRAETPEQKRAVVERVLRGWLARPYLRLGQLLVNAAHNNDLFYLEDEHLAKRVDWPIGAEQLAPTETAQCATQLSAGQCCLASGHLGDCRWRIDARPAAEPRETPAQRCLVCELTGECFCENGPTYAR